MSTIKIKLFHLFFAGIFFPDSGQNIKKAKIFTKNTFDCKLSWVRPNQKYRTDLLEHEQGHFDLCEIYTRQLRKRLEDRRKNLPLLI
jgi:hypothetical protein